MPATGMTVRALQVGEGLDIKGLEREDAFSNNPLAFRTSGGGMAMLFKTGAIVFADMTPVEEEKLLQDLAPRIAGPLELREIETAHDHRQARRRRADEQLGRPSSSRAPTRRGCCWSARRWPSPSRSPTTNAASPRRSSASSRSRPA